jgi:hypothetical protein
MHCKGPCSNEVFKNMSSILRFKVHTPVQTRRAGQNDAMANLAGILCRSQPQDFQERCTTITCNICSGIQCFNN